MRNILYLLSLSSIVANTSWFIFKLWEENSRVGAMLLMVWLFLSALVLLALYDRLRSNEIVLAHHRLIYEQDLMSSLWTETQTAQVKLDRENRSGLPETVEAS